VALISAFLESLGVSSDASLPVAFVIFGVLTVGFLVIGYRRKQNVNTQPMSSNRLAGDVQPISSRANHNTFEVNRNMVNTKTITKGDDFDPMELHTIEVVSKDKIESNKKYQSESLAKRIPAKKTNEPYDTFSRMRKIGHRNNRDPYSFYGSSSGPESFLQQAEFMKSFTDNYESAKPLEAYWTTYESMDNEQLRTYFTWRTKVREGNITEISLSYAFCYIYELLNHVEVSDAVDGLNKLISFWSEFRKHNDKIDRYMISWVKDYYVIHSKTLGISFEEVASRYPLPHTTQNTHVENIKNGKWDLELIELHSTYRMSQREFYKKGNTKVICECLSYVLEYLNKWFRKNNLNFVDLFVGEAQSGYWASLQNAVYVYKGPKNTLVKLSEHEVYECKNGQWSDRRLNFYVFPQTKGYILKAIEIQMRKVFGGKQNLKPQSISDIRTEFTGSRSLKNTSGWKRQAYELIKSNDFEHVISNAIQAFIKQNNVTIKGGEIVEVAPVEIDMSQLGRIREEQALTAAKLNTDEDVADVTIVDDAQVEDNDDTSTLAGLAGLTKALDAQESATLLLLLHNKSTVGVSSIELTVEQINEKALEIIGDNLIEEFDGKYSVYVEYSDELLELLEDK